MRRRRVLGVLAAIFFASGASSLIFETLWFHQAALALGSSVWASSVVLSAFMAGLALGGGLVARAGNRILRPLHGYVVLEAGIAVAGVALVYLLPTLGAALAPALSGLADRPLPLNAIRLAVAFVLLVAPATAMGATLPLMTAALSQWDARFGRVLGALYGTNTLGAVIGVAAAETLLVGHFGVHGSALLAGGISALASGAALVFAMRVRAPKRQEPALEPDSKRRVALQEIAAFGAGFALLGLEVVWLRFLSLFVNGTPLAFAMVVGVVLSGIALGGVAAGVWCGRSPGAHQHAGFVALGAGALGVAGLRLFPAIGGGFLASGEQPATSIVGLCAPIVLPTALASGALFTLIGASLAADRRAQKIAAVGRLTLANTSGAALGALVAGFVLLPGLGMERALLALLTLYGAVGALLLLRARTRVRLVVPGVVAFVVALALFPVGAVRGRYVAFSAGKWMGATDRLLAVREGRDATLMLVEHRALGQPICDQLLSNAFSMSTTCCAVRRYAKLFAYLPLAIRPRVRSALVIGYGAGNTVQALVDSRELESIDVVDVSRDILATSEIVHADPAHDPLHDPRVHVHVEDGRWFLQATAQRFDLVTGEPPPHNIAGVANLYSTEYFRLVRARLNPGGVVTYWFRVALMTRDTARAIVRAFCDAFDDCSLWHASGVNLMLTGTNGAAGPVAEAVFTRQWRDAAVTPELAALGFERPERLGALFVADSTTLRGLVADAPPVTDDHPDRLQLDSAAEPVGPLVEAWRDEDAARERFAHSGSVAKLWPPALRERTLAYFDEQRLLNDLLFPDTAGTFKGSLDLVDRALAKQLSFTALLMLESDPDLARAAEAAATARPDDPDVLRHRATARIARGDFAGARDLLGRLAGTRYEFVAGKFAEHFAPAGPAR